MTAPKKPKKDPIACLLGFAVDVEQTPEEAEQELREMGVDVPSFLARVQARRGNKGQTMLGFNGKDEPRLTPLTRHWANHVAIRDHASSPGSRACKKAGREATRLWETMSQEERDAGREWLEWIGWECEL